jgi:hypothetical protein
MAGCSCTQRWAFSLVVKKFTTGRQPQHESAWRSRTPATTTADSGCQTPAPSGRQLDVDLLAAERVARLDRDRLVERRRDPERVEYLERHAAGDTFEPPQLDRGRLAEIVVLASEWIVDAGFIKEDAEKIRDEALALYREQTPQEELQVHKQRVLEWHQAEAERRVGDES